MTGWTEEEVAVTRAISRALLIWEMGRGGVMAASPELIDHVFEDFWKSAKPMDAERREAYRYAAQAAIRTMRGRE
jgi:hypothetical protein